VADFTSLAVNGIKTLAAKVGGICFGGTQIPPDIPPIMSDLGGTLCNVSLGKTTTKPLLTGLAGRLGRVKKVILVGPPGLEPGTCRL
jgi:hypothetical protein